MSLKNLKPITIQRNRRCPTATSSSPSRTSGRSCCQNEFRSSFRSSVDSLRSRAVSALRVTIQNEDKVVFNERVNTAFPNGVYYVQDIRLENAGVHTVCVTVEGGLADDLAPLVLKTQVFEFMELHECPDLEKGAYQPLREFVLNCIKNGHREQLRDDSFLETYVRTKKHSLRNMDARWWLRAFVQHTLDREEHKKEHDNLFARRKRDWKRVRAGDLRMFTTEPLHAGATTTVYSSKEMFRQLSLYAQV
ncbi:hypothetical protein GQ600_4682 [Phytophthora cactorum]|nr:hypothetical protein GQ600_4682 [Phytophthora cactorum]